MTDGDVRRALLRGNELDAPASSAERPTPVVGRAGMPADEVSALFDGRVRVVPLLDEERRVADLALLDRRARLPVAEPLLGELELRYVTECIVSGWISSAGAFVTRFEELFADFCGTRHAVAVGNGTQALHLALLALDVGPGDEVIVPTLTFIATANAVTYTGARAIPVDSEPVTWNLDPAGVEAAITPRTKAILPVHLYGHPADLDTLLEIADRHGLALIEDAAEAHGATYKSRPVGGVGDLGVFSFYGNKIVTTGEGGMIVTDRDDLAERIRMLRSHGMSTDRRYWHPVLGYNYRLTNLQAAVGVAQMERIDEILRAKRTVTDRYTHGLAGIPGITLPPEESWATNVFWLYSILVDEREFGMSRDALLAALDTDGIEGRPFFAPIHRQPLYDEGRSLPVAERLAAEGLSLPSAVTLTEADVARVVDTIARLARKGALAR
jgi:perosamine synthetase